MNEEKIRREAKEILDKFARALAGIKIKESFVERDEDKREEKDECPPNPKFQKIFLENAPSVRNGCVLAEKGKWK